MGKIKTQENKDEDVGFNAYAIGKGSNPLQFRLIRLKMKGKALSNIETVLEEILPVVVAKVEYLLKREGCPNDETFKRN